MTREEVKAMFGMTDEELDYEEQQEREMECYDFPPYEEDYNGLTNTERNL